MQGVLKIKVEMNAPIVKVIGSLDLTVKGV